MSRREVDAADRGALDEFLAMRPRLFTLARRMLGSPYDADDAVQDAWMRWQLADHSLIGNHEAWLVSVTTRLCIDRLRSARRTRSRYVGPWLPEPVGVEIAATDAGSDPVVMAERNEELGYGFLLLLEQLGPLERAVFLLRDAFGYSFDEIGRTVDRTEVACRKTLSRARRKLGADIAPPTRAAEDEAVVSRFLFALATGDSGTALTSLAADVVLMSDGGPQQHAARRPVVGPDRVSRLMINIAKRLPVDATVSFLKVDGSPGFLVRDATGEPLVATWLTMNNGEVRNVYTLVERRKLRRFADSLKK
jgi:RNA polymerase sigma-70 factor, ECF subfamily